MSTREWNSKPGFLLLAGLLSTLVLGVLIAVGVIDSTSGAPPTDVTSPAGLKFATRSLPPYWIVRAGDSYDSIAAATRLSVAQLGALNPDQDPNALVPGERLLLHLASAEPRTPARPRQSSWVVRPGDTFSSIAASTGWPVYDIAALNPSVNPNLLRPGQRLRLRPGFR